MIDETQFFEVQTAALNECLRGIDGAPLREAGERRAFHLYYQCGNAIGLLTESTTGGRDLFDFWRTLISESLETRRYEADDYYEVWRELGGDARVVDGVRRFVEVETSPQDLLGLMRSSGIQVAEAAPSQPYGQSVARDGLLHLMSQVCRGSYGFNASPEGLRLSSSLDCGSIPGGGIIRAIGGHDVLREGHATWDHLHERCGSDQAVQLEIEDEGGSVETITVPCDEPVAPRPGYVEIRASNEE